MLNIAICDDNKVCLQELRAGLAVVFENRQDEYKITGFTSGSQLLCGGGFDVVFLDVEMDGIDGMETARRLRERGDKCKLIFLTAHQKYAISAFDVEATQYLMKPLDPEKLKNVMNRILGDRQAEVQHFISVKQSGNTVRLPVGDILYIEVFDRKVFLHTAGGIYDFYEKLDVLESSLPSSFFRCHRSYIVNLGFVRKYDKTTITLINDEIALISKRRYGAFCQSFLHFLKKGGGGL